MCGRFVQTKSPQELITYYRLAAKDLPTLPLNWNVAPTNPIYIIRENSSAQKELAVASWGLIAPWSDNDADAVRSQSIAINARMETVDTKPTFRDAFASRRCLIPATGYYEWATELTAPHKQPFYVSREDSKDLFFAGIWSRWTSPSGATKESAALITRPASGFLADIHSRMPIFLARENYNEWLSPKQSSIPRLRSMFEVAVPEVGLQAWPVSKSVGVVANNGPEMVERVEIEEGETLF
jgi:putative SOS response-associated peptidase YedK